MDFRGAPDLGQPGEDPGGQRAHIRQRMRTVIGQLEGILRELKQVARELREVSASALPVLTTDPCPHPLSSSLAARRVPIPHPASPGHLLPACS